MVSVAKLLNPEPPRAPLPISRPAPVSPTSQTATVRNEAAPVSKRSIEALRMMENNKTPRCKARGAINFPPFESLDESSLREVRRFQVHPFGSIRETCERIPYNSGKKDFFSKTGREGFEAFHYDFRVPGDDTNYTVMWDYNVGLVRMTSFFKCRGYSKTTPAKMLNSNPGLKDITYSITGGSIKAQGYWMPYICAKAICATFCHKIAGALIPLFGPQFPFECIPEKAPGHGRMIINPELVARAKNDAAALFRSPPGLPSPRPSRSASPLSSQRSARMHDPYDYHSDHDRRLLLSPYTDTDVDYHPVSEPYGRHVYSAIPPMQIPTLRPPFGPAPAPTPLHSPGWIAVNNPQLPTTAYHHRTVSHLNEELLGLNVSPTANPWLSAIPRSPTPTASGGPSNWHPHYPHSHHHDHHYQNTSSPVSTSLPERGITLPPLRLKRRFDQTEDAPEINDNNNSGNANRPVNDDDDDKAYDAEESRPGTASPTSLPSTPEHDERNVRNPPPTPTSVARGSVKSTQPAPCYPSIPILPATTAPGGGGGDCARRASERDAAIMLLNMCGQAPAPAEGRAGDSPFPSSSSSPSALSSPSPASSSSDGYGHGNKGGAGSRGFHGRKQEGKMNGGGVSGHGQGVSDSKAGGCATDAGDFGEVAVGSGSGGPNTRAKRRRTVEG